MKPGFLQSRPEPLLLARRAAANGSRRSCLSSLDSNHNDTTGGGCLAIGVGKSGRWTQIRLDVSARFWDTPAPRCRRPAVGTGEQVTLIQRKMDFVMKRSLAVICLLGLLALSLPENASADGWSRSSGKSQAKQSGISTAIRQIDTGAKKLVQGTIDLITLKPFRQKKPTLSPTPQPWLNNTPKKTEKKPSFWSSLFRPEKKPKRVETMSDFVGLERPS
jgi:hypothetical protein